MLVRLTALRPYCTNSDLTADALDQIKYQSKDGADAMFVEALDEAVPSHIVRRAIGGVFFFQKKIFFLVHLIRSQISCKTDDNLGSMSGCELSDGKLYLVFKSAKVAPGYFECSSGSPLENLQSLH